MTIYKRNWLNGTVTMGLSTLCFCLYILFVKHGLVEPTSCGAAPMVPFFIGFCIWSKAKFKRWATGTENY